MTQSIPFQYEEAFVPPRCRKSRQRIVKDTMEIHIPEATLSEAPVALRIRKPDEPDKSAEELRFWGDNVWVRWGHYDSKGLAPGTMEQFCAHCKAYSNQLGLAREVAMDEITAAFSRYLIVGGDVYEITSEPMYFIETFSSGVALSIDRCLCRSMDPARSFNALEYEAALEYAKEIALSKKQYQGEVQVWYTIEVLVPDAVRIPPQKERMSARIMEEVDYYLHKTTHGLGIQFDEQFIAEVIRRIGGAKQPLQAVPKAVWETIQAEMGHVRLKTPHGVLHAFDGGGDEEHPGIRINLELEDGSDVALALVEYTADEGVASSYDPRHPEDAERERGEVPEARRDGEQVTAGIITRAWPNEKAKPFDHRRVIHTGYLRSAPARDRDEANALS